MARDRKFAAIHAIRWSRCLADRVAEVAGGLSTYERRTRSGLVALLYHRVLPDDLCAAYPLSNLVTPESVFRAHIEWLSAHCDLLTVTDALSGLHQPASRARVCVTFDDGYWDNAEVAARVLDDRGAKATFYIATDLVEHGRTLWFDIAWWAWLNNRQDVTALAVKLLGRVPESLEGWMSDLKGDITAREAAMEAFRAPAQLAMGRGCAGMTPADVRRLARAGHEIGAHTRSHPILVQLDDQRLAREVRESVNAVRDWTGAAHVGFAYPNGTLDDRVRRAVVEAGASHACTTRRGVCVTSDDRFLLPRRAVFPDSVTLRGRHHTAMFRAEIFGFHDAQRSLWQSLRQRGRGVR